MMSTKSVKVSNYIIQKGLIGTQEHICNDDKHNQIRKYNLWKFFFMVDVIDSFYKKYIEQESLTMEIRSESGADGGLVLVCIHPKHSI